MRRKRPKTARGGRAALEEGDFQADGCWEKELASERAQKEEGFSDHEKEHELFI